MTMAIPFPNDVAPRQSGTDFPYVPPGAMVLVFNGPVTLHMHQHQAPVEDFEPYEGEETGEFTADDREELRQIEDGEKTPKKILAPLLCEKHGHVIPEDQVRRSDRKGPLARLRRGVSA